MRTTLTLDPDVSVKLKERLASSSSPMKEIVNQALRIGLSSPPATAKPPFKVIGHALGLRPDINPDKLNQFLDDLDAEEYLAKQQRQ